VIKKQVRYFPKRQGRLADPAEGGGDLWGFNAVCPHAEEGGYQLLRLRILPKNLVVLTHCSSHGAASPIPPNAILLYKRLPVAHEVVVYSMLSIAIPILIVIHVAICLLMVLVVLMQRPRSEGLGAAFGGGMTENLFGAQTTHVLQKFTVWLGIGFFVVTLLLAMAFARSYAASAKIQQEVLAGTEQTAPAVVAEPVMADPVAEAPVVEETDVVTVESEAAAPASEVAPEEPAAEEESAAPLSD